MAKKNFVWSNSPGTSFTPTRACEKPDAKVWCAKCKAKAEAVAIIYMVAELCGVPGDKKNVTGRCAVASVCKSMQPAKPFQSKSSQSFAK